MPIGVIVNALSVLLGGVMGSVASKVLSDEIKTKLTVVFGLVSICMGVNAVVRVENMPAVILALTFGTLLGIIIKLGDGINKAAVGLQKIVAKFFKSSSSMSEAEYMNALITIIVLFCASGTGIYGSLDAGMSGDHTILISKSILDFFTAAIFATNLGPVVSAISIPQFIIFYALFVMSRVILPMTTPAMIADFKACGGFLMVATGFRILKIKDFPLAEMLPAMVLVFFFSAFWVNIVIPLL